MVPAGANSQLKFTKQISVAPPNALSLTEYDCDRNSFNSVSSLCLIAYLHNEFLSTGSAIELQ